MYFLKPLSALTVCSLLGFIFFVPANLNAAIERPTLTAVFLPNSIGCDDTRKRVINRVLEDAASVFSLMEQHSATRDAMRSSSAYRLAFGSHASPKIVRSCIANIANTISIEIGSCKGRGAKGAASYWAPTERYIGFGSTVWLSPPNPVLSSIPSSALGTVIHEMSHAVCGTTDTLYDDDNFYVGWHSIETYNRARKEPRGTNELPDLADAYRLYAEQLWYQYIRMRELSVDPGLHPVPAQKPEGKPYCGDFEGIDWPAIGLTSAIPRGYMPSRYQAKPEVPDALFAGPYQWGGARCGGRCQNVLGLPLCKMSHGGRSPSLQ